MYLTFRSRRSFMFGCSFRMSYYCTMSFSNHVHLSLYDFCDMSHFSVRIRNFYEDYFTQ